MWHKPLGKLEARKQNNFQVVIGGNVSLLSPPFCGLLHVFMAYLLDKGTSGRAEPAGSAPDALFPDSCY